MFSSFQEKGVWIWLCAEEQRISDPYHPQNGGVGKPKLPGKFFGDILVDLRVRNIELRSPVRRSRAQHWSLRVALLGAVVTTMFPVRVEALSCSRPEQFYFLDCEGERCRPLFRTAFSESYGCAGRIVLETIEAWEVNALSAEIDRRGLMPDGVVEVWVGHRLFPPEHEMLQAEQLESATMKPVAESAETVRREWKHRAREQLLTVVILRLPVWVTFLFLVLVSGLAARSVWRNAIGHAAGGKRPISVAVGLQVVVAAVGACAFLMLDDPLGEYSGLWPIALAGAIALSLLVAELAAIGAKRGRNRTSQ